MKIIDTIVDMPTNGMDLISSIRKISLDLVSCRALNTPVSFDPFLTFFNAMALPLKIQKH